MKKIVRIISFILACIILVGCFTGCGIVEKQAVKKLIHNFETACHNNDFEAMLDCFNPAISDTLNTISSLFHLDDPKRSAGEILDSLGIKGLDTDNAKNDFLESVKIKVNTIELSEDETKCTVSADLTYTLFDEEYTKPITLKCKKTDDNWYFSIFG